MEKRLLFFLFLCSMIPFTIGSGVLPLLPVFAAQLGASPAAAGLYLAISYLAITLGAVSAAWVAGLARSYKKPLVAATLLAPPLLWLTGQAAGLGQLTAATAALWFLGGVGFGLTSILAGIFAGQAERGKVFGILSLAGPLGLLLGGLASGPIADRWGYPAMFTAFAAFALLYPLAASQVRDAQAAPSSEQNAPSGGRRPGLGRMFWLLFLAGLAASTANFVGVLGRSLSMDALGFNAAAISGTGAVGGAVALPVGLLSGLLSDRIGRKGLLAAGFLAPALGLVLLVFAGELWHFWLAVALLTIQNAVSGAVGSALAADLLPRPALGQGMALFSATSWVGGVIGFAATGLAVQTLGLAPTFLAAALLAAVSTGLIIFIRPAPSAH